VQIALPASSSPTDDQPLRLLLVRSCSGELPWLARVIAKAMAPLEIVEVIGFANAIWRLGNERFDSVLLDLEIRDPAAMAYCREQIADVAAVPVLDLREHPAAAEASPEPAARGRETSQEQGSHRGQDVRKALRVPWQRRPRRQEPPAPEVEVVPAG
jgi:hypothetical protein